MNPRRWVGLTVGLLGLFYLLTHCDARADVVNPVLSVEGPFTPTVSCPPNDAYEWRKTREPATVTLWAVPTNDWEVIGPYNAMTYRVGSTAIIYARTRLVLTPDATAFHEFCHALGWTHPDSRGYAPDARFTR